MTYAIFVHPDDLAAIAAATGPAPIDAPQIVSNPYLERGQIFGPLSMPSFENLYNAKPDIDWQLRLDSDERINWAAMPKPGQYFAHIETGPMFAPESPRQNKARCELNQWMKRHSWRNPNVVWELRYLLDPNYRHPKRKRP